MPFVAYAVVLAVLAAAAVAFWIGQGSSLSGVGPKRPAHLVRRGGGIGPGRAAPPRRMD